MNAIISEFTLYTAAFNFATLKFCIFDNFELIYFNNIYCLLTPNYVIFTLQSSRSNQRTMFAPPKLTIRDVFKKLTEIAQMSGNSVSYNLKI